MIPNNAILRYCIVGSFNTVLTFITILILVEIFYISPNISNFVGYMLGYISSYILNRKYTFGSNNKYFWEIIRYNLSYLIAFLSNYVVFISCNNFYDYKVGTLIGMIFFSVIFYVLNRYFVYKRD